MLRWFTAVLALAATNWAAGRLGLVLAISPGFATAVFPPPGIAIGVLLARGRRLWPGIFLGSFLFNLEISLRERDLATAAAVAALIALGSSLQALLAERLVRPTLRGPTPLSEPQAAARFLVFGGPIACLVASTLGVVTLTAAGFVPPAEVGLNVFTWWVGDTLGVIVFAPITLALLGRPRERWRGRVAPMGVPLATAFALSVGVFVYASRHEQHLIRHRLELHADAVQDRLDVTLAHYLGTLHSVADLHAAVPVDQETLDRFVERPLRLTGIRAFGYNPYVPDTDALEERFLREKCTTYRLKSWDADARAWVPGPVGAGAVPACRIAPIEGNEAALGVDLASEPVRRAALERARDTGVTAVTAPLELAQQRPEEGAGLLLVEPVYRGRPRTVEERRASLQGFAVAVVQAPGMLARALADTEPHVGVELLDEGSHLYDRRTAAAPAMVVERRIEFGGRRWLLRLTGTRAWLVSQRGLEAWGLLAGGVLFSGLLGAFLMVESGRRAATEELVAERTRELVRSIEQLEAANRDLEGFSYSVSHDLRSPLRAINGYAQILVEDHAASLDDEARRLLGLVRSASSRMGGLIDGLLRFAQAGRRGLHVARIDMAAAARGVFEEISAAEPGEPASLEMAALPPATGDPELVRQVWQNLLSNALKFTRERSPRRIVVEARDGPAGFRTYVVRDNGVGFDMRYADKLFGVFERLHTEAEYPGTGVGLALVRRIVERHGGRVWAESAPGEGASFFFTLPVC